MFDIKIFSERLKTVRTKKGLSQADFAKAIGVSAATISSYETANGAKIPALDKAAAIADVLEVSLDWLCGLSVQESDKQTTVSLLGDLVNTIIEFGLDATIRSDICDVVYAEINSVNPNFIDFITELKKILPILEDEKIPDYLKTGLKTTLLERYKDFEIEDFI